MKFCEKCGKELLDEAVICPGCGCAVEPKIEKKEISYDDCVKSAGVFDVIGIAALALGVVLWLFINVWVGAILCLVAELVVLIPNSKVQSAFKQNGLIGNSKEVKLKRKEILKELRSNNAAFACSFIIAIIAFVLLLITVAFI